MANFIYNVEYNENDSDLAFRLVIEVEEIKNQSEFQINEMSHSGFKYSYRIKISDERFASFGIKEVIGKMQGVGELEMHFSGSEANILETKNILIEKIKNLSFY